MTPFCPSRAGGLHATNTDLEVRTCRVKFSGGAVGTATANIEICYVNYKSNKYS